MTLRLSAVLFLLCMSLPVLAVPGLAEDIHNKAAQTINENEPQLFQKAPQLSATQEPTVDLSQIPQEDTQLPDQKPNVESPKPIQEVPQGVQGSESPGIPIPAVEKQDPAVNVFDQEGLGYKISYPTDWIYQAPTQYQFVFSGKEGTPAYYSTVSVQNIAALNLGGKHDSADSVKKSLIEQLNSNSTEVKIYGEKPFSYSRGDKPPLSGVEFMAEYTNKKERFKQWIIIVERAGKEIFHIWAYTSPIEQYDAYSTVARDMLNSWAIK